MMGAAVNKRIDIEQVNDQASANTLPTLVFDYDGTIQETMKTYIPAVREVAEWLRSKGYPAEDPSEATMSTWLGIRNDQMWEQFAPGVDPELRAEGGLMIGSVMRRVVRDGLDPWFDGVREVLDQLKSEGYPMFVLSNCDRAYRDFNHDHFQMDRWFSDYVDCESWNNIPKSQILTHLMEQTPGKYIMIGDRFSDLEAAEVNGIPFIACDYGYAPEGELAHAKNNIVLRRSSDVAGLISVIHALSEEMK